MVKDNTGGGAGKFSEVIDRLLARPELSPELLKSVLDAQAEREKVPLEVQIAEMELRKRWFHTLPQAGLFTFLGGLFTAIGGLLTAYLTGHFDNSKAFNQGIHLERMETMKYQSAVFDKMLVISEIPEFGEAMTGEELVEKIEEFQKDERRNRICMAAHFGIIEVADEFLVSDPKDRDAYQKELTGFLDNRYRCKDAEIPIGLPSVNPEQVALNQREPVCSRSTLDRIKNRVTLSGEIMTSTKPSDVMLVLAVSELNKGVNEMCDPGEIQKYWQAVGSAPSTVPSVDTPWSAAFISWVLQQSGNPHDLALSANSFEIWRSGIWAGLARPVVTNERLPRPGDLVVYASRTVGAETMDRLRLGEQRVGFVPMTMGVILSADEERISYISGNVGNAVSVVIRGVEDPQLVGVLETTKPVSIPQETPEDTVE